MQTSIVSYSYCRKLDFKHFLFSPDFFLQDKIFCWNKLDEKSTKPVSDYFHHVIDVTKEIKEKSICYDLTDGLSKFMDGGVIVENITNLRKIGKAGDFVISRLRSYLEEMGMIEQRNHPQIFSTEFLIFRSIDSTLSTHILFSLCMTRYVQKILARGQHGTEHPRFYDFLLEKLPVPDCLLSMDRYIKSYVENAINTRKYATNIYQQAHTLLLDELGLTHWQPKHHLAFVKNYSDTEQAKRIDAEYFQPMYDDIINAIKNYSGDWDMLKNLVTLKDENFYPRDTQKYRYIELANLTENGEIAGYMFDEGQNLPSRARRKISAGDVIVSSIEGSLSSIALVEDDNDQAICSTGFYVIDSPKLNSETLLIALKSVVGQSLLKKGCSGTILTAMNKEEFGKIVLPKVAEAKQAQIQQKVTEAFNLRKQSKHLLECAKRAVEIAIEKNEEAALKWLENETM